MDWSTSALMNNSPLARRLPGQRTPPDPIIGQPNAADLTYGWHANGHESSSGSSGSSGSSSESQGDTDVERHARAAGGTRQQEAATALRRRRRERRAEERRRTAPLDSDSSTEGSIVSYNSATDGERTYQEEVKTEIEAEKEAGPSASTANPIAPNIDSDSFICRICFDGPGSNDEGGETLGKLIAPCRCRGTMKFVHQACLTRWRATSMRASSIMACDQCGSPYKFRKSKFVGLATNRLLILAVSCLLFITLIWSVGFTAESIVRKWDSPDTPTRSKGAATASKPGYWQFLFNDDEDTQAGSFYDDDDDVYTYGYGYVSTFYWEPLSYFRLIKAAVKHVGSGRATQAVKDLVKGESIVATTRKVDEKKIGWFSTLLDDWKYGSGGIWEGQRPETKAKVVETPNSDEISKSEAKSKVRYDAQTASELKAGDRPRRASKSQEKRIDPSSSAKGEGGWWDRITVQFSLGFSLVGIFSFLNLLLGVSLWGPFQLGNFGLGHSFARLTGGGRRRGGGGGGGGSDGGTIASVVLLFLVIIGILRALIAVISLTTYLSKRLLTRVEDYIVEYSGEEIDQGRAAQNAEQAPIRRHWWSRG